MTTTDPTRIKLDTDPTKRRMSGTAIHGNTPFDVPFISEIAHNLWQGGCETGLILPDHIKHLVSLYPWERSRHGAHPQTRKTHCPQDHPYDRVYYRSNGRRQRACSICTRESSQRRRTRLAGVS